MKIKSITKVGIKPVYDITVKDVNHYILQNGVVTHNTSMTYSSNNIFIITKSQEKDKEGDLEGWKFTINIHKSRYVKEKSKLPFRVLYNGGIQKYSGMLDIALEGNFVKKPKVGWYSLVDQETGELSDKSFRAKDFETDDLAGKLLSTQKFKDYVNDTFKLGALEMSDSEIQEEDFEE